MEKNEAELAMPGLHESEDIMGFRQVTQNGLFCGPVYLRRSFHAREPQACQQMLQIFSGKNQ